MKKISCLFIVIAILFSAISCSDRRSAYELLSSFADAYGVDGVVYSSSISEGNDGYIDIDLFRKIYAWGDEFPQDFAVLLNSHTDSRAECAVFICRDGAELDDMYEMCRERLRILAVPEQSFIVRTGMTLFYSAMPDAQRAKDVWHRVIS